MIHILTKDQEPADLDGVTHLLLGASWDPSTQGKRGLLGKVLKKGGMDLDLLAFAMQGEKVVRMAGLDSLDPMTGAVVHSGDSTTGAGAGDDETITVDLLRVPPHISSIVFVAAAYKKYTSFGGARNVSFRVYDGTGGSATQVAEVQPDMLSTANAIAIARVFRVGASWKMEAIEEEGNITQGEERSLALFAKRHGK